MHINAYCWENAVFVSELGFTLILNYYTKPTTIH